MANANKIDYVVIGHIVQDVVPEGYTVGGTTTYSSITARNLGRSAGIVTRLAPDFVTPPALSGIEIRRVASAHTTTFHNIYHDGHRQQFLLARADELQPEDVPADWRTVPIIHLGPLDRELDARFTHLFPHSLIGVTPQGWLRKWDEAGKVSMRLWVEAPEILPYVGVLVLSEEDLNGDVSLMDEYARLTRIAIMTQGPRGCVVYTEGKQTQVPGYAAVEVDPTGAGDVFAAAYLIRLSETQDPIEAARFANATASFCVEAPGITGIPTRAQVEARLAKSQIPDSKSQRGAGQS